ncbi:hypothetical protein B7494_g5865 [Chlorociboria aeruginascens]|nr:hypothetical protein B7494_g5865 [Chlorociboria aeruginascens]
MSAPIEADNVVCEGMVATSTKRAFIALGSNLGDRIEMIETACNEMTKRGIKVKRTSCLWETDPMYVLDQERFINGACEVETSLEPLGLLDTLQGIENDMGRKKIIDKGPRNIDLDILLYEDDVIDHERLKIPHPGIYEREFVLRPLAELIPSKPLDPASPWKVTQDYLNALPSSPTPLSTVTPIAKAVDPLCALKANRSTHVMAIFNATRDSFSDGYLNSDKTEYVDAFRKFATSGATIIDIGGQSSAPGAIDVPPKDEAERVRSAIKLLRAIQTSPKWTVCDDVAISADTYRASVAELAIGAGADIINDVSAGTMDSEMFPTMARLGKTIILNHMRGTPKTMTSLTDYPEGLISTIAKELLERVAAAEEAGIRRWRIILDPGIGFAKTGEQNLEILRRMDELRDWPGLRGLPWLVGPSRKRFIGRYTNVKIPKDRVMGTAVTVAAAIQGGADIVRVHDVSKMVEVAKIEMGRCGLSTIKSVAPSMIIETRLEDFCRFEAVRPYRHSRSYMFKYHDKEAIYKTSIYSTSKPKYPRYPFSRLLRYWIYHNGKDGILPLMRSNYTTSIGPLLAISKLEDNYAALQYRAKTPINY